MQYDEVARINIEIMDETNRQTLTVTAASVLFYFLSFHDHDEICLSYNKRQFHSSFTDSFSVFL